MSEILSARELAISIAADRRRKDEEAEKAKEASKLFHEKRRKEFVEIIEQTLEQFKEDFDIHVTMSEAEWSITRKSMTVVLLSIKLSFETGTFDGSDDCRNIPYEEWAVRITEGFDTVAYVHRTAQFAAEFAKAVSKFY